MCRKMVCVLLLQWGRNLTVAEGTGTMSIFPVLLRFNGAAT